MHDRRSVTVAPLSAEEIGAMRAVARGERGPAVLTRDAVRLGFLKASLLGRLDADAALGLNMLEADMLMGLAREPARSVPELRTKAALFRSRLDGEEDGSNLSAMLFAAIEADAGRLGMMPEDLGANA